MNYYRSLGEGGMNNEQLAMQAAAVLNNQGGNLSEKQNEFAYDILSSYQMLQRMGEWELQYKSGGALPETPRTIPNTGAPADSPK